MTWSNKARMVVKATDPRDNGSNQDDHLYMAMALADGIDLTAAAATNAGLMCSEHVEQNGGKLVQKGTCKYCPKGTSTSLCHEHQTENGGKLVLKGSCKYCPKGTSYSLRVKQESEDQGILDSAARGQIQQFLGAAAEEPTASRVKSEPVRAESLSHKLQFLGSITAVCPKPMAAAGPPASAGPAPAARKRPRKAEGVPIKTEQERADNTAAAASVTSMLNSFVPGSATGAVPAPAAAPAAIKLEGDGGSHRRASVLAFLDRLG
jgi:hypothetical protein